MNGKSKTHFGAFWEPMREMAGFPKRRKAPAKDHDGFSEEALRGLEDLDARCVPPGIDARPAFEKTYQNNARLAPDVAAGGGLLTNADGSKRPHYWGHRKRLRERFLSGGHKAMPEYELLELLLFNAIERIDVKPLAKRLLAAFGDLNGVVAASEHRLLQVEGATPKVYLQLRIAEAFAHRMGQAKVLQREVVSSWDDLITYCRTSMAHRDTEQFRVLYLDRKNTVIADEEQAEGTVDHVPVYPRELAKRALELNACAIILVHNHPSGDPTPSPEDIRMTTQILATCDAIGVTIHDHVVIGKETEFSFRSEGYFEMAT
ncbi:MULTISPECIES: DNA repair protein RadC [unclassified Roseovarius]|uniref:RadC family protein n=1 Tax=unclassified Roseovarius TaxID=2614913 RepID=UPI00273FDF8D|nr:MULTISPECIES: DNA repair protein RadC [unclassified Roseovarius]